MKKTDTLGRSYVTDKPIRVKSASYKVAEAPLVKVQLRPAISTPDGTRFTGKNSNKKYA